VLDLSPEVIEKILKFFHPLDPTPRLVCSHWDLIVSLSPVRSLDVSLDEKPSSPAKGWAASPRALTSFLERSGGGLKDLKIALESVPKKSTYEKFVDRYNLSTLLVASLTSSPRIDLHTLELTCYVTDAHLLAIAFGCPNLRDLTVDHGTLTDAGMSYIAPALHKLVRLTLQGGYKLASRVIGDWITTESLPLISRHMTRLETLAWLGKPAFVQRSENDEDLLKLTRSTSLTSLHLSCSWIRDEGTYTMLAARTPNLRNLRLCNDSFEAHHLIDIQSEHLEDLSFEGKDIGHYNIIAPSLRKLSFERCSGNVSLNCPQLHTMSADSLEGGIQFLNQAPQLTSLSLTDWRPIEGDRIDIQPTLNMLPALERLHLSRTTLPILIFVSTTLRQLELLQCTMKCVALSCPNLKGLNAADSNISSLLVQADNLDVVNLDRSLGQSTILSGHCGSVSIAKLAPSEQEEGTLPATVILNVDSVDSVRVWSQAEKGNITLTNAGELYLHSTTVSFLQGQNSKIQQAVTRICEDMSRQ